MSNQTKTPYEQGYDTIMGQRDHWNVYDADAQRLVSILTNARDDADAEGDNAMSLQYAGALQALDELGYRA